MSAPWNNSSGENLPGVIGPDDRDQNAYRRFESPVDDSDSGPVNSVTDRKFYGNPSGYEHEHEREHKHEHEHEGSFMQEPDRRTERLEFRESGSQSEYNREYHGKSSQPSRSHSGSLVRPTKNLFEAITQKDVKELQLLIDHGEDMDSILPDTDSAPIILTSKLCYNDILEVLARRGANLETPDKKGWTALHWTAVMNNIAGLGILLEAGANVNARTRAGKSAFDLASIKDHAHAKDFLMRHMDSLAGESDSQFGMSGGSGKERVVRACVECGGTKTPQWRRGPDGSVCLCNACGLRYIKSSRKKAKGAAVHLDQQMVGGPSHGQTSSPGQLRYSAQPHHIGSGPMYGHGAMSHPQSRDSHQYLPSSHDTRQLNVMPNMYKPHRSQTTSPSQQQYMQSSGLTQMGMPHPGIQQQQGYYN
eukprot:CFRG3069T1